MPHSRKPRLTHLWHTDVHRKVGREELAFFWVNFDLPYDPIGALRQAHEALRAKSVRSYAVWELLGEQDLLVRVYLPPGTTVPTFRKQLDASITDPFLARAIPFTVHEPLWHWMTRKREVTVEAFWALVDPHHLVQLAAGDMLPAPVIRFYEQKHLLFPVRQDTNDIKFFTRVSVQDSDSLSMQDEKRLDTALTTCISRAARFLTELALYKGSGFRAQYLVTGRVAPGRWKHVTTVLTDKILALPKPMKTITHLASRPLPLDRRDHLPDEVEIDTAPSTSPALSLPELCEQDESDRLEFKGSAFTDIDEWVNTGHRSDEMSRQVFGSLVKSITGFLNARAGGHVVIGILELERFPEARLAGTSLGAYYTEKYTAIGVKHEYKRGKGWDEFERRLRDKLCASIQPDPSYWLDLRKDTIGGAECCVIRVRKPGRWFFAKEGRASVFYVRQGNSTKPLSGPDMTEYQGNDPR